KNELIRELEKAFEAKKFNEGLIGGVDYVSSTVREHAQAGAGKNAGRREGGAGTGQDRNKEKEKEGGMSPWAWICPIVLVLLGIWLVIGLVRAFTGGGGGGYGGGGGGGGGGFFTSLLGGMFGAAAGMRMYDQFFGGHSGM